MGHSYQGEIWTKSADAAPPLLLSIISICSCVAFSICLFHSDCGRLFLFWFLSLYSLSACLSISVSSSFYNLLSVSESWTTLTHFSESVRESLQLYRHSISHSPQMLSISVEVHIHPQAGVSTPTHSNLPSPEIYQDPTEERT